MRRSIRIGVKVASTTRSTIQRGACNRRRQRGGPLACQPHRDTSVVDGDLLAEEPLVNSTEQVLDGWRGNPADIANRLIAVQDFSEPFYESVAQTAVRLAAAATGNGPDSPAPLVFRLHAPNDARRSKAGLRRHRAGVGRRGTHQDPAESRASRPCVSSVSTSSITWRRCRRSLTRKPRSTKSLAVCACYQVRRMSAATAGES